MVKQSVSSESARTDGAEEIGTIIQHTLNRLSRLDNCVINSKRIISVTSTVCVLWMILGIRGEQSTNKLLF